MKPLAWDGGTRLAIFISMGKKTIERLLLLFKVSSFQTDDRHFYSCSRILRWSGVLSALLSLLALSELSNAESVYQALCSKAGLNKNQVRSYENNQGEYVVNIQMLETYKHYRGCTKRDPSVKIDPLFEPKLQLLENELKKHEDVQSQEWLDLNRRSFEIFRETQAIYQEYIEKLIQGRTSAAQKKILAKIKERIATVRINKSRDCNSFNSDYNFVSHSIDTCNELLSYPRTTLMAIYAHEITHSIDPCSLQFSLSHIDKENPFSGNQLMEQKAYEDAYTALPSAWAMEDLFLEKDQLRVVMAPLPFKLNPFHEVLECLQSKESVHAQKRKNPLEESNVKDDEHMCSSTLQDGQMAETFADWMAYEVLASYLKKQPSPKLSEQIFEGTLNIIANECEQLESEIEVEMRKAITASAKCRVDNEKFFNFQKNLRGQKLLDTHLHGSLRINKLYAVHPTLRRFLQKYLRIDEDSLSNQARYCK
ncbi:MAG: hypothetical protein ACXVB1_09275 [Pseudobdellovibrionaceae bacterium]